MSNEPNDIPSLVAKLDQAADRLEKHDKKLRSDVAQLGERLREIATRVDVRAMTTEFTLEEPRRDERVYGWLGVDDQGLYLAVRSTVEDLYDDINNVSEEDQGYTVHRPESWSVRWLRVAASRERLAELLADATKRCRDVEAGRAAIDSDMRKLSEPSGVADELVATATRLGYGKVVETWQRAQQKVYAEPENAITLASSLLETTLKHVITELEIEMPNDESVTHLYRAVAKRLNLTPNGVEDGPVRGVLVALNSIVSNVGTHRTRMGDAHGRTPSDRRAEEDEARLMVNAAGIVCTYVMRQLPRERASAAGPSLGSVVGEGGPTESEPEKPGQQESATGVNNGRR